MKSLYEIAHRISENPKDNYCITVDGTKLEGFCKILFSRMGFIFGTPAENTWMDFEPEGFYRKDDKFEFDFLLPIDDYCIVGEITARSSKKDIEIKFSKFCKYLNYLSNIISKGGKPDQIWAKMVKDPNLLRKFRDIKNIKGFFISTNLEKYDVEIQETPGTVLFYKSDWMLLVDYAETLGEFAQNNFLHHFKLIKKADISEYIALEQDKFLKSNHKQLTTGVSEQGEVYIFQISPYKIIPYTHVFRRDELPSLSIDQQYQRPLSINKIYQIRKVLRDNPDFMFPNSILVVLSETSIDLQGRLCIPKKYGALALIDGQHRLFSYASSEIENKVGKDANIIVTAIRFFDTNLAWKYSARTFIEINTNQTRVDRTLIDSIAFDILGQTDNRAIGAQVLLRANQKSQQNALYGLFDTRINIPGNIKPNTIITSLQTITDLNLLSKLNNPVNKVQQVKKEGYSKIFKIDFPVDLRSQIRQEEIIQKFSEGIIWYYNSINEIFPLDFPQRGKQKNTSLEYAKVLGGFLLLLRQFTNEGESRKTVKEKLLMLRENLLLANRKTEYNDRLFKNDIPGPLLISKNSIRDNYVSLRGYLNVLPME